MKRLTYIKRLFPAVPNTIGFARETNSPLTSWSRDPFFEDHQPRNRLKSAMGSIAIIDQHKILFPVVTNTIYFTRETKSPFTSGSRSQFFEGQ